MRSHLWEEHTIMKSHGIVESDSFPYCHLVAVWFGQHVSNPFKLLCFMKWEKYHLLGVVPVKIKLQMRDVYIPGDSLLLASLLYSPPAFPKLQSSDPIQLSNRCALLLCVSFLTPILKDLKASFSSEHTVASIHSITVDWDPSVYRALGHSRYHWMEHRPGPGGSAFPEKRQRVKSKATDEISLV